MARLRDWSSRDSGNSDVWTANLLVARLNLPGRIMQSLLAKFMRQFLTVHNLSVPDAANPSAYAVAFVGNDDELGQGRATALGDTSGSVVYFKLPDDLAQTTSTGRALECTLKVGTGDALNLVYDDDSIVTAGDLVVERAYSVILAAGGTRGLVWKMVGSLGSVRTLRSDLAEVMATISANRMDLTNIVGQPVYRRRW